MDSMRQERILTIKNGFYLYRTVSRTDPNYQERIQLLRTIVTIKNEFNDQERIKFIKNGF